MSKFSHTVQLKWEASNPMGLRDLPYPSHGITREFVQTTVVQLWREGSFADVFDYLQDTLSTLGVRFFSPGGTIPREVVSLLWGAFDLGYGVPYKPPYLRRIDVRIGLDLIADEVVRRHLCAQPGVGADRARST